MSVTQLYAPEEFFETANRNEFRLGQICWVPVPSPDPIPRILDVQRSTPEEHEEVKFELRLGNRRDDFKQHDRNLPIKYLNLKSNLGLSEELFNLFLSMFLFCISGRANEHLEAVKELVREAYMEETNK